MLSEAEAQGESEGVQKLSDKIPYLLPFAKSFTKRNIVLLFMCYSVLVLAIRYHCIPQHLLTVEYRVRTEGKLCIGYNFYRQAGRVTIPASL
jgi:hypothetical protein